MQINPIQLDIKHTLLKDYYQQTDWIQSFFQYNPFEDKTYQDRLINVRSKSYKRTELIEILKRMNRQWDAPETAINNIDRLDNPDSSVVIAGQQAGLLTGPLYTLSKIISVIQFANDQEQKRQAPVIPVFWIAGEDHDFAEINHVYMPEEQGMKKMTASQHVSDGTPVSDIEISETDIKQWLDDLFGELTETEHTAYLYDHFHRCLNASETYVDFFAQVIHTLFPDTGLVLFDSGNHEIRRLESEYFVKLIENQRDIAQQVHQTVEQLKQAGYNLSLDTTPQDGHLFYHVNGLRYLLMREGSNDNWVSKQGDINLSTDDMLHAAQHTPERLSNNVVTRPLMQEWLFPTLAFLGGPGEVSYWSALKPAFDACGLDMPPVVLRRSFTLVDRDVEAALRTHHIDAESAIEHGVSSQKMAWLASQQEAPVAEMVEEIKRSIETLHQPLQTTAKHIRADIGQLARSNRDHINRELDFLENRMNQAIKEKYAHETAEFDSIEQSLHPEGGLQERIWNPLPFINAYSMKFVEELTAIPWSSTYQHVIVYL